MSKSVQEFAPKLLRVWPFGEFILNKTMHPVVIFVSINQNFFTYNHFYLTYPQLDFSSSWKCFTYERSRSLNIFSSGNINDSRNTTDISFTMFLPTVFWCGIRQRGPWLKQFSVLLDVSRKFNKVESTEKLWFPNREIYIFNLENGGHFVPASMC